MAFLWCINSIVISSLSLTEKPWRWLDDNDDSGSHDGCNDKGHDCYDDCNDDCHDYYDYSDDSDSNDDIMKMTTIMIIIIVCITSFIAITRNMVRESRLITRYVLHDNTCSSCLISFYRAFRLFIYFFAPIFNFISGHGSWRAFSKVLLDWFTWMCHFNCRIDSCKWPIIDAFV